MCFAFALLKSWVGARDSGSHPRFRLGPVYCLCPSQNIGWEPEALAPTQDFGLDLCIVFVLLKILGGSQRFWLPPKILPWTCELCLPDSNSLVGARGSGSHPRYWFWFTNRFATLKLNKIGVKYLQF